MHMHNFNVYLSDVIVYFQATEYIFVTGCIDGRLRLWSYAKREIVSWCSIPPNGVQTKRVYLYY